VTAGDASVYGTGEWNDTSVVGMRSVADLLVTLGPQMVRDSKMETIRVTCGETGASVDIPVMLHNTDLRLHASPSELTLLAAPAAKNLIERKVVITGSTKCLETLTVVADDPSLIESVVLEPRRDSFRILRLRIRTSDSPAAQATVRAFCRDDQHEVCEITVRMVPKSTIGLVKQVEADVLSHDDAE
jgi:hypothetical protein